jgi:hypothetical protein
MSWNSFEMGVGWEVDSKDRGECGPEEKCDDLVTSEIS